MTGPEIARLTGLTADSVRVNLGRGMSNSPPKAGGGRSGKMARRCSPAGLPALNQAGCEQFPESL
jgi:hypothetical protein